MLGIAGPRRHEWSGKRRDLAEDQAQDVVPSGLAERIADIQGDHCVLWICSCGCADLGDLKRGPTGAGHGELLWAAGPLEGRPSGTDEDAKRELGQRLTTKHRPDLGECIRFVERAREGPCPKQGNPWRDVAKCPSLGPGSQGIWACHVSIDQVQVRVPPPAGTRAGRGLPRSNLLVDAPQRHLDTSLLRECPHRSVRGLVIRSHVSRPVTSKEESLDLRVGARAWRHRRPTCEEVGR